MKKWLMVITLLVVSVIFLYLAGLLTFQGLCGFKSGALSGSGKAWGCTCIGIKEEISSSYFENQYCTGINLSYNRLLPILYKNQQFPIYKPQGL